MALKREGGVCFQTAVATAATTATTTATALSSPFIMVPGLLRLRARVSQALFHGEYAATPWGRLHVLTGSLSPLQNTPLL